MKSTINFINNNDPMQGDRLNELTPENCQDVVDNNVKRFCHCNEEGATSMYCDIDGQKCQCKENFKGEKCQIEQGENKQKYKKKQLKLTNQNPHFAQFKSLKL